MTCPKVLTGKLFVPLGILLHFKSLQGVKYKAFCCFFGKEYFEFAVSEIHGEPFFGNQSSPIVHLPLPFLSPEQLKDNFVYLFPPLWVMSKGHENMVE